LISFAFEKQTENSKVTKKLQNRKNECEKNLSKTEKILFFSLKEKKDLQKVDVCKKMQKSNYVTSKNERKDF
jgi:hypothetical protein